MYNPVNDVCFGTELCWLQSKLFWNNIWLVALKTVLEQNLAGRIQNCFGTESGWSH